MNNLLPKPILKWAGGKRQLVSRIVEIMPEEYSAYYEPFIGGGALLFAVKPSICVINDLNEELINVYSVIANHPGELKTLLEKHQACHCKDYYYKVRSLDRTESYKFLSDIERAARTIYLNRTCFNGLYRVNRSGYFNTPMGTYEKPLILDSNNIDAINEYFGKTDITFLVGSYTDALKNVSNGDFVYLDPPYDPVSESSDFTSYTKQGFSRQDQEELRDEVNRLTELGAKVLVSNSDTEFINNLYADFEIIHIEANRSINSNGNSRRGTKEVLIKNY